MLKNGGKDLYSNYASSTETCVLCVEKLKKEKNISRADAELELKGSITGKKVLKFNNNGSTIILCEDCLREKLQELYMEPVLDDKEKA